MSKDKRRVQTSLPPLYARLVVAEANYTGESESSIVSTAVKNRYDAMPIQEKDRILKFSEINK